MGIVTHSGIAFLMYEKKAIIIRMGVERDERKQ